MLHPLSGLITRLGMLCRAVDLTPGGFALWPAGRLSQKVHGGPWT